jgi:hypothetical protein
MSTQSDTYRIELLGFPGCSHEEAVAALVDAFGIDEALAHTYVAEAPVTVRTGVDGGMAKEYTHTLLGIGASVRVLVEATGREREFTAGDLVAPAAATEAERSALPPEADESAAPAEPPHQRSLTCPACGHRQAPARQCAKCAYAFPVRSRGKKGAAGTHPIKQTGRRLATGPELDVFATLRTSGELRAVRDAAERRRVRTERRDAARAQRQLLSRKRVVIYGALAVLLLATLLALALLRPELRDESDPLPPGALEAPPGFEFRRN